MTVDYLDVDVAYLLGLIVARGELIEKRCKEHHSPLRASFQQDIYH